MGEFEQPEQDYIAPEEAQKLQLQIANEPSRVAGVWHRARNVRSILIPVLALAVYSLAFWFGYNWYRSDSVESKGPTVVADQAPSIEVRPEEISTIPTDSGPGPAVSISGASLAELPQEARPASRVVQPRTAAPVMSREPEHTILSESSPGPVVFEWQAPATTDDTRATALSRSLEHVKSDAADPKPVSDIPTDSGYVLQLAAIKDRSGTQPEWERFQSEFPRLLGDMKLTVEEALVGGKTYFRIQTGPFPTKATALDLCAQLKEKKQDCLVKRTKLRAASVF
jgi:hypothetical protein